MPIILLPLKPLNKYKIVDVDQEKGKYIVQCSFLRAVMKLSLDDIVADPGLILGFPSEQACFLGIKVASFLSDSSPITIASMAKIIQKNGGKYSILSEMRGKKICFIDREQFQKQVMCPITIATDPDLINNFGPGQSFYIGYLAGTIVLSKQSFSTPTINSSVQLRIVK